MYRGKRGKRGEHGKLGERVKLTKKAQPNSWASFLFSYYSAFPEIIHGAG